MKVETVELFVFYQPSQLLSTSINFINFGKTFIAFLSVKSFHLKKLFLQTGIDLDGFCF